MRFASFGVSLLGLLQTASALFASSGYERTFLWVVYQAELESGTAAGSTLIAPGCGRAGVPCNWVQFQQYIAGASSRDPVNVVAPSNTADDVVRAADQLMSTGWTDTPRQNLDLTKIMNPSVPFNQLFTEAATVLTNAFQRLPANDRPRLGWALDASQRLLIKIRAVRQNDIAPHMGRALGIVMNKTRRTPKPLIPKFEMRNSFGETYGVVDSERTAAENPGYNGMTQSQLRKAVTSALDDIKSGKESVNDAQARSAANHQAVINDVAKAHRGIRFCR